MCGILFVTREYPVERSFAETKAREMLTLAFDGLLITNNRGKDGGCGVATYTPYQPWKLHPERSAYDDKKREFEDISKLYERFMNGFDRLTPADTGAFPEAVIGHVRYSTQGEVNLANVHPLMAHHPKSKDLMAEIRAGPKGVTLALAVNGETWIQPEWEEQIKEIDMKGATSDSAKLAGMIVEDYLRESSLEKTLSNFYNKIFDYGMIATSGILVDDEKKKSYLFWMADGGRPLYEARINGYVMGISEKSYPQMLKIQGRHDVTSIKKVKGGTIRIQDLETKAIIGLNMDRVKPSCFFEDHYFKRPENAGSYRRRCGRCLAKEHPPPPGKNVVIAPVPQSGNSYAHGYSHKSRVHIEEILLRSPLSKEVRAFIASQDPVLRGEQALLKFIVAAGDCKGKKIVIVDDSLVEGNVSMKVNYLLRRAGALEVHGRSGCPPIVGPCRGGIDIPEDRPLVRKLGFNPHAVVESHTLLEERLKCVEDPKLGTIKFDSFGYLSIESLKKCLGGGSYCTGCVTLEYPYMFKDMEKCGAKFVPVKPRKKTEDKSVPKE